MTGRPTKSVVTTRSGAGTSSHVNKRTAVTPSSKKRIPVYSDSEESTDDDEEVEVRSAVSKNKSKAKRSQVSDEGGDDDDEENEPPKKKTARSGTSDKKASDKKVKKDDERVALVRPELGDHLDCTICLDKPASPIHSCANGHIICGICADKVKKCGMCQTALHVSAFAERLSRQLELKLSCLNQNSGCNEVIAAAEMKRHLQTCDYRDIICAETGNQGCGTAKVALHEYAKHLREHHKCHGRSCRRYAVTLKDFKISLIAANGVCYSRRWAIELLGKDGHTFLLHSHIGSDSVYFWVTVLGGKDTAEKYMFEFKLFKKVQGGKQIETSWKMPVLAFHHRPNYVEHLPGYVVIPAKLLSEFCAKGTPADIFELCFDALYKII